MMEKMKIGPAKPPQMKKKIPPDAGSSENKKFPKRGATISGANKTPDEKNNNKKPA